VTEAPAAAETQQVCRVCVMDRTDPEIRFFGDDGCNHCIRARQRLATEVFRGPEGQTRRTRLIEQIRADGRGRDYDCVIGLSGGLDSTYVAWQAKQEGLRPLAVHLDNGWNSELAVANIEKTIKALDIDLFTHVVDWEEFRDLQLAFFRARVVNIEIVTDHAITAILYRVASKQGLRWILSGSNVATESIMPEAWGYDTRDARHVRGIHARFGRVPISTFPLLPAPRFLWHVFAERIRFVPILNYGDYRKSDAVALLRDKVGWTPYAKKHGESRFTDFYQNYYLPTRFGFDKRKAHYSSLIVSGQMTRDEAMELLERSPWSDADRRLDIEYVIKKLGLSAAEFEDIMAQPPASPRDYPNNAWMFSRTSRLTAFIRRLAKGELTRS
jgi:N-acetyl sugar amidotransferase